VVEEDDHRIPVPLMNVRWKDEDVEVEDVDRFLYQLTIVDSAHQLRP